MFGDPKRGLLASQTATFVALIAVGGWISIPFIPVPITLQTLFVLLSGAVMGRHAVIPASLCILLGVLGLPVFHNGLAGPGVLLGPTGGYIVGFVAAAYITGLAYERGTTAWKISGLCAGTAAIYCFGLLWLMVSASLTFAEAFLVGVVPFVAGDLLKAAAVFTIAERIA
jgi:biotin transport system substrate-specific component